MLFKVSRCYFSPIYICDAGLWGCYPRDVVIAYGNEIIEAPMAARMRYFEYRSFRRLCKEYFQAGADWSAAPKPFMSDDLFDSVSTLIFRGAGVAQR